MTSLAQSLAGDLGIPLHLAVHVLGATVAAGLVVTAVLRRRDAWTFGAGWLALGGLLLLVNHVVRGAVLVPDAVWPVYLRTGGYAALAIGAAGSLVWRPHGAALGAVPLAIQLAPAAPTTPYITAGVAGVAAALASLRGVMRRSRAGLLLASGLALWAVGDLFEGTLLAAALSVAGSLAIGLWLLRLARTSLLSRLVVSFLGALLVLVLGLSVLGGVVLGADIQEDELAELASVVTARTGEVRDEWTLESLTTAQLFSSNSLARVLESGDVERAQRLVRDIAELPGTDVVVLVDADGGVVASFAWAVEPTGPLPAGDALVVAGDDVVSAALRGTASRGLVALGEQDLLAGAATPVFPVEAGEPRRDEQAGALFVARRAADRSVVEEIARNSGADVTVLLAGEVATTTLPADIAEELAAVVTDSAEAVDVGPRTLLVASAPFEPAGGSGRLVLTQDVSAVADAERSFTRGLFLAALAGAVVAGLLAAWSAGRTTRPVRELTAAADRVAAGDREVRTGIEQPDEIGRLARSFDEMTSALAEREEELQEATAVEASLRGRLEVLTASMGEGLVAVDPDGAVQTINPAAERLLRVRGEQVVREPIESVLRGPNATALLTELGPPGDREVRATRGVLGGSRDRIHVAATAAPLTAPDGSHQGRVYVLRDVTGEAEAERMKTHFLANVSHELRTPLTPIKGYAEVLRKKSVSPEKAAEFASNIAVSTSRLERVIGMLVDFASLEAGRLDVRSEPTGLSDVVDEVLERWRDRQPERRFTRRLSQDLPPVQVDPDLLSRALEELMDNAVKFSDGPVRIRAASDDGVVDLVVVDEGIGIPDDQLHLITRDFHQVDGSATRRYGGLGLGLSLVQRIAERFDAEVVIDSEMEEGTEIHLLLPVSRSAGSER